VSRFELSGNFSAYKSGDYVAFNNTWGAGDLVNGADFYQVVRFDTTDPTTGITFSWSWPERSTGQIYGFPSINWGDSPFYDGAEECRDYVSKVSDLKAYFVDLDLGVSRDAQYANLTFDLFLTSTPFGGESSITSEVMIWLDNKALSIWGDVVGQYSNGAQTAKIYFAEGYSHADYIAVVFDKPMFSGSVDIKAVLQDLARKGLISADDYVSGHQFGAELAGGKGSFTVNSLTTTFERSDDETPDMAKDGLPENLTLRGSARNDKLFGEGGDDVLQGMRGRDRLDGGEGIDTASYKNARSGVVANLEHTADGRGDAKGDRFISIENLHGSKFADRLTGDSTSNVLDGFKGDDYLIGGAGADVFVFASRYGTDVIGDFEVAGADHDRVDLSGVVAIDGFDDLIANHIRDIGSSLVIAAGDGSKLKLAGIHSIDLLTSDHFIF
jgi:hypothetical protein